MSMDEKHFRELCESVKQMGKIRRKELKPGRVFRYDRDRVKLLRTKLNLSQDEFSQLFKVSVGTVRGWEQGRRTPEGAARCRYLRLLKSSQPQC